MGGKRFSTVSGMMEEAEQDPFSTNGQLGGMGMGMGRR